jgi:chromosome segregation ATPase
MSTPLATLISDADVHASTIKAAADNWLGYVKSMQADIQRLEAELEQKRRAFDQQTAIYQQQIAQLKSEKAKLEQEVKQLGKDKEREQREIGMVKERFLKSLEGFGTAA